MQPNGVNESDQALARDGWKRLGRQRQREVARLSRQGRVHEDPDVAGAAYRWARARLPRGIDDSSARIVKDVLWVLADIATGGGPSLKEWKARRLASRIIVATESSRRRVKDQG